MFGAQEVRFQSKERQLAGLSWGAESSPLLLCLHGWLDNAASFARLAEQLPDYRLLALDWAGHGLSDHRAPGMRYHTFDHLDDLHAVLTQLPDAPTAIVAHSLGAGLSLLYAGMYPDRVARLVLIDGFGPLSDTPDSAPRVMREALESWASFRDGKAGPLASREAAIASRQQGIGGLSAEAAAILCERGLVQEADGAWYWRTDKRLRLSSPLRMIEEQVCAFVAEVTAPTLLIEAEHGFTRLYPDRFQQRFAAHRQLQRLRLPGSHHLHLDGNAEGVAAAIRTFLAAV